MYPIWHIHLQILKAIKWPQNNVSKVSWKDSANVTLLLFYKWLLTMVLSFIFPIGKNQSYNLPCFWPPKLHLLQFSFLHYILFRMKLNSLTDHFGIGYYIIRTRNDWHFTFLCWKKSLKVLICLSMIIRISHVCTLSKYIKNLVCLAK